MDKRKHLKVLFKNAFKHGCFMFLITVFVHFFALIIFADSDLTEMNEEYPNADSLVTENVGNYPYYIFFNLDSDGIKRRYIYFFDQKCKNVVMDSIVNGDGSFSDFYFKYDCNIQMKKYYYDFNTSAWVNYDTGTFWAMDKLVLWGFGLHVTGENVDYLNYDIKTENGTTVFREARYLPTTIIGQISSKSILKTWKTIISGIAVLAIGLLILVNAFWKGWTMLKTVLYRS